MIRVLAPLALLALPVAAQEIPVPDVVLTQCLDAGLPELCIGMLARLCENAEGPGSGGVCRGAENAVWLGRIGTAEAALREREPEAQARAERLGWPDPVPSVEAIAGAFAAYRDAACSWRAAAWEGIHAGVEEMDCLMRLNARQALLLEGFLDDQG